MAYIIDHPWLLGVLFAIVLSASIEMGLHVATRARIQQDPDLKEQMSHLRDSLFILSSLMLGFTLAMVATWFNERRILLVQEAESIKIAYLRAAFLPPLYRDPSRQLIRQYVDTRLAIDDAGEDQAKIGLALTHARQIQKQLWQGALNISETDRSVITNAYMTSLIDVIDLQAKRTAARENRLPRPIWLLILAVPLITVFTRGLTLPRRFWLALILAPVTLAIVVYLIAELNTPNTGLIQTNYRAMQRVKVELNDDQ